MKWQDLSIAALLLISVVLFTINDSSVFLPVPTSSKTMRVPIGAVWINFTSLKPVEKFSLTEFYPDQSFIGRYNIKIQCLLFLGDHSPTCSVVCRNLWNSSAPWHEMSTNESFHKTYSYSYSQPTTDDPDFSIQLKLKTDAEITSSNPVEGWILLSVDDYGVTERPEDFIMPTPVDTATSTDSTATTTETGSTGEIETTSSEQVSFTSSSSYLLFLGVLFLWKKTKD